MKKTLISMMLTGILLSSAAFADQSDTNGHKEKDGPVITRIKNFMTKLDLTSDQKKKLADIKTKSQTEKEALRTKMKENWMAMKEYVGSKYDAGKVKDLADEQGALVSQRIQLKMKTMNEISKILTPEQQQKVEQFRAKIRSE